MSEAQNNKKMNAPSLRFPEFSGEWEEHYLTEYLDFKNGLNPSANKFGSGIKFISVMDILNNDFITYDCIRTSVEITPEEKEAYTVEKGDILFQRSSETLEDVGRSNVYMDDKPAVFGGFVIRGKKKSEYNPLFFRYLLASPFARREIIPMGAGAQHFNIGQDGLSKVRLHFPTLQEQQKIADFLNLMDSRISIQSRLIEDCITLEKELLNLIFNRIQAPVVPLSAISQRVVERNTALASNNVLTISARDGLISQLDFFNKAVASENLSNYFLLRRDDFAYNKSYSSDHPWGAIKHLDKYEAGVLSPLYFCFRPIKGLVDVDYLQFYFETNLWHKHIAEIAVEGARNHGLLNMAIGDFFELPVPVPSLAGQQEIAAKLSVLKQKRENAQHIHLALIKQKDYLLKHLFV